MVAPLFVTLVSFVFLTFEALDCVSDGSAFLFGLTFLIGSLFFSLVGLFEIGVSVHEQVNHDVPLLVAAEFAAKLEDFLSEEPEAEGN